MSIERLIGVISDTHGLVRDEVKEVFKGLDLVLHAGDVGKASVLEALRETALVVAVRGNADTGDWSGSLNETEELQVSGKKILIIHQVSRMNMDPVSAGIDIVIHGHTHKPDVEISQGVLYLNPGSSGPRRFALPVSVALLRIKEGKAYPEIIEIAA